MKKYILILIFAVVLLISLVILYSFSNFDESSFWPALYSLLAATIAYLFSVSALKSETRE